MTKMAWPFFKVQLKPTSPEKASLTALTTQCVQKHTASFFLFGCPGSSLLRWAFSSCSEWGLLSAAAHRLLTVASLVVGHGLWGVALRSCSTRALGLGLSSGSWA